MHFNDEHNLEFIRMIIPKHKRYGILVMLEKNKILHLFLAVKDEDEYITDHEIQSFRFRSKYDAVQFSKKLPHMSAIDLMILIDSKSLFLEHTLAPTL